MKILYFTRDYTTHDRRFLLKLAASRHSTYFLRLENDGLAYESRPLPPSVTSITWRGGRSRVLGIHQQLGLMTDLENVLTQIQPDLIQAGPVQSCGFLAALTNFKPLVVMSWGSDVLVDADRDETWFWITKFTLGQATAVLSDCSAVTHKVLQFAPELRDSIIQFPWGIDIKGFAPDIDRTKLRELLDLGAHFVVLSTRSWEDGYGIDVLLDAFRIAYRTNSRIRLVLLGDGSLASRVRAFVSNNALDDVVQMPGLISHDRLPGYFRAADLYLACTRSDGSSVSLLEAMATGLPVVVSDVPGNREWINPGENGWLVPPNDAQSFAKAILEAAALTDSDRASFARRNREVTVHHADWDANFGKLLEAYARIEHKFSRAASGVHGVRCSTKI